MGLSDPADLDSCVMKVLRHFEMPASSWGTIVDMARRGGAMSTAGVTPHLMAVARDLHDDAFFVTQYFSKPRVCRTQAGSRPGESLADLVFSFVYDQVLQRIRDAAKREALTDPIPFDGERSLWTGQTVKEVTLTDATWADDSAFMAQAPDPDLLMRRARKLAAFVYDFAKDLALDPNLKAGKTEMMISLRGKGSRAAAAKWFGPKGATLEVETRSSGKVVLRVVADYVHLGFHIDKGVSFRPEALRRLSQASGACREFNAILLRNPMIPRSVRAALFHILVESTFFNLELWTGDEPKAWKKLVDGQARLQRGLLRCELSGDQIVKLSPADVSFLLGVPSMGIMLRGKRLRYLITLVKAAPSELWAVLKAQKAWMSKLLDDMEWLVQMAPGPWPRINALDWPSWWHLIQDSPGWFKRQIGKAVQAAVVRDLRPAFEREAVVAIKQISSVYGRMNKARHAASDEVSYYCGPCGKHFARRTHFACHLRHMHARRADHLHYCGGTVCPGCRRDFHSWARILKHLKITPRCLAAAKTARLLGEQPTHGEGSKLWKEDVAKHPAIVPALQTHQKFILYDDDDDSVAMLPREKLEEQCAAAVGGAVEDWMASHAGENLSCALVQAAFWQVVRTQLLKFPLFIEELQRAIDRAKNDITGLHSQAFEWPVDRCQWVASVLCQFRDTLTYASLAGSEDAAGEQGEEPAVSLRGDTIHFHEPFMFTRGHVIAMVGDELPGFERTRLYPKLQECELRTMCCGWDWPRFRDIEVNSLDGICMCISRAWEVRDAGDVNFGWGSFALESWSEHPMFWQARIVRFACHFARQAWRLLLHGRQVVLAFQGKARHLQHSEPLALLRSHGRWATWSSNDWVFHATASAGQVGCIVSSWGFTLAC